MQILDNIIEYYVPVFFLLLIPTLILRGILIIIIFEISLFDLILPFSGKHLDFAQRLLLETGIAAEEVEGRFEKSRKIYKVLTLLFWMLLGSFLILGIAGIVVRNF